MTTAKGAKDPSSHRRPTLFYASAREGFADYLRPLLESDCRSVLLPAFIGWSSNEGSGVLDPVESMGLTPAFYRLNHDLTVNVADLERRLSESAHLCVVVIHYYGRTDPSLDRIADLADRVGTPLVEDLAHGLFTSALGGVAGRRGAASLYSLHKMLPLPDGGMIVYDSDKGAGARGGTRPELAGQVLQYDWSSISRVRRAHFERLTHKLRVGPVSDGDVELVWPELTADDVPQTLPLFVHTGIRDELYHRLNAEGHGVVSLYHTMVSQLDDDNEAQWSASRILNLPVHQDVQPDALDDLVARMEGHFQDVRRTR